MISLRFQDVSYVVFNKFELLPQGSAATYLRLWWALLYKFRLKFNRLSSDEQIFEIGQDYTKLRPWVRWDVFFWDTVYILGCFDVIFSRLYIFGKKIL